jgi:hypothetical protein
LGVSFIWELIIITIGGIMGKKRRVLKSPKFANLRRHPKYSGMIAAREQEKEEFNEVAIKQPEPEITQITQIMEIAPEPEITETTPEPKVVKLEKPKPAPKAKAKSRTKKTTAKKTTAKKTTAKKSTRKKK